MTATIIATTEPDATPPRVRLNVTTDQPSITLYRVEQDGTRTAVRSYDGGPFPVTSGTLLAYDPEPSQGLPVYYTADGAGVTNSAQVTVTSDRIWLVHPGVPARSQPVTVAKLSERVYDAAQSVRYPLNRKFPIVATDGRRKAPTYDLTIRTTTLGSMGAIEQLLADMSPLLLSVPAASQWGQVAEYVAVGRVTMGRIVAWGPHPMREWLLPCSVVDRPAGGSQVDNTYAKSYALYPTYAARYAAHATYAAAFDPQ